MRVIIPELLADDVRVKNNVGRFATTLFAVVGSTVVAGVVFHQPAVICILDMEREILKRCIRNKTSEIDNITHILAFEGGSYS